MDNERFHNDILKTIEKCSYWFYVVQPDKNYKCTCVNHTTKQPDPNCKNCLGTGFKIRIKKFKGASYDKMKGTPTLGAKNSQISKYYFIPNKYKMHEDDLIIDENEIFYVFRVKNPKGLAGYHTHQEVICSRKNNDQTIILKHFVEIINQYLKNKK